MLALRLPPDIEERLDNLARRAGRTKRFYAREAILDHLDDLEDVYWLPNASRISALAAAAATPSKK